MKKLYLQTYGCQMNQYDSERIAQVMGRVDYESTDHIETADLVILTPAVCAIERNKKSTARSAGGRN